MYSQTTRQITINVNPTFLEDESSPEERRFIWAYTIRIENSGAETVQLLNRAWQITDANGKIEKVSGPGVVGEQPVLSPGESYEYTSGCPLATPSGIMVGSYEMETEGGERFDVAVPAFSLDSPHDTRQLH
ncbi:MAG: Co2+/Mg2+ efflux protein ApaG [Alphaproteobacteria bacterium]|nr:Co2+/Mg2+ efflux protein ApaG [Alphaproteobacteria bacterium]